jgi:hypothetical protein
MMKGSICLVSATLALACLTGCNAVDSSAAPAAAEAKASSYDKPGFVTAVVKGRLWVFADGSEELAAFRETGKTPAVHVVRPLAGPDRLTLIAVSTDILDAYMK